MKNYVYVDETAYKVDAVNRVVICTLSAYFQPEKTGLENFAIYNSKKKRNPFFPSVFSNVKVTAKARCNAEDEFNEEVGKRIAESRAKAKLYSIASRVYEDLVKELEPYYQLAKDIKLACEDELNKELKHTKMLIDEIDN